MWGGDSTHLLFLFLFFLVVIVVIVIVIIPVIISLVFFAVVLDACRRSIFANHPTVGQLFHHLKEFLAVIFQQIVGDRQNIIYS